MSRFLDSEVLYQSGIGKAGRRYRLKASRLYKNIPGFLSAHDKRIVLKKTGASATFDDYSDVFYWLGDSMIANLCFRSDDPNVGFSLSQNDSAVNAISWTRGRKGYTLRAFFVKSFLLFSEQI